MPEFEIEVLSNPWLALNPDHRIWDFDDYSLYAAYDADLIKPALLFADHVKLATFRETMRVMTINRGSTLWHMPMQRVTAFLRLAIERDERELELLGLDAAKLPTRQEAKKILSRKTPDGRFQEFWTDYEEQVDLFGQRAVRVWRERYNLMACPELREAINSGLLTVEGWLEVPDELLGRPIPEDVIFGASVKEFLDRLANTSGQAMLDVGAESLVQNWPKIDDQQAGPRSLHWSGPTIVAANAIMRLPGLERLSIQEILDIRRDLGEYLPAFRSEMVKLGEDLADSVPEADSAGLVAEIDRRWFRDIAPIVEDIKQDVASASYPRRLLNSITAQRDVMVSTGGAIVLATGSVAAGVSTLVPAAVAAAYPLAKALNETISARANVRKNRLYLLYALDKRIHKRRR